MQTVSRCTLNLARTTEDSTQLDHWRFTENKTKTSADHFGWPCDVGTTWLQGHTLQLLLWHRVSVHKLRNRIQMCYFQQNHKCPLLCVTLILAMTQNGRVMFRNRIDWPSSTWWLYSVTKQSFTKKKCVRFTEWGIHKVNSVSRFRLSLYLAIRESEKSKEVLYFQSSCSMNLLEA